MSTLTEQRMDYANRNFDRYTTWAAAVCDGPYTPRDKLEWAIITAHCPFDKSVAGFLATRAVSGLQNLAEALATAGVMAPGNKAAYITRLRHGDWEYPAADYRDYRQRVKLPGLGHCKLSFAACLIDPFGADVICLDTHMLACYGAPFSAQRAYANLKLYEEVEDEVLAEANAVGMPPFPYQWAVWDWWRAQTLHRPTTDHSFLWQSGPSSQQLPLFNALS